MVVGEVYQKILEYLKKNGSLNTFRLARDLNLDRSKLLNFIEKLEKAGAVEVQHGAVKFLKFVVEEMEEKKQKNLLKLKRPFPSQRRELPKKEKKVKEKLVVPKAQAENQVIKSKAFGTPEAKPLNELKEKILQLESKVEELEKKASAPPKIIKKTIVKEVPAHSVSASTPYSPRKKSKKKKIKEVKKKPKRREEKKKSKKAKKISKKFKFPKFTFMKKIKQLKKPEFIKKMR